jgi:tetratricopeptide (TPR) repeat protein
MMLGLGLLGWAGETRYHLVARFTGKSALPAAAAGAKVDARAQSFLADGERALSEGDLEKAQADFDKASVLMDRNPRVLLDEAFVAAGKADIPWLKLRLLPADENAKVEARTTRAQLDESAAIARRAANDAMEAAPTDGQAARALFDALRIAGEGDAARARVAALQATESQPQTAYVLAMLDLAQPSPRWTSAIERLRLAANGEGNVGRARAALIYALVKSSDLEGARAELAKLDALPRPYPLQPELHALVFTLVPAPVVASAPSSSAGPAGASTVAAPFGAPAAPAAIPAAESVHDNAHGALETAAKAIGHRDFDRAEQIYQGILTGNPNDSQAVAGLGDVASARGNSSGAIAAYRRATAINPSYLPAWLGLADSEWASGDKVAAARVYKDVLGRFPEGTYPAYVTRRAAGE